MGAAMELLHTDEAATAGAALMISEPTSKKNYANIATAFTTAQGGGRRRISCHSSLSNIGDLVATLDKTTTSTSTTSKTRRISCAVPDFAAVTYTKHTNVACDTKVSDLSDGLRSIALSTMKNLGRQENTTTYTAKTSASMASESDNVVSTSEPKAEHLPDLQSASNPEAVIADHYPEGELPQEFLLARASSRRQVIADECVSAVNSLQQNGGSANCLRNLVAATEQPTLIGNPHSDGNLQERPGMMAFSYGRRSISLQQRNRSKSMRNLTAESSTKRPSLLDRRSSCRSMTADEPETEQQQQDTTTTSTTMRSSSLGRRSSSVLRSARSMRNLTATSESADEDTASAVCRPSLGSGRRSSSLHCRSMRNLTACTSETGGDDDTGRPLPPGRSSSFHTRRTSSSTTTENTSTGLQQMGSGGRRSSSSLHSSRSTGNMRQLLSQAKSMRNVGKTEDLDGRPTLGRRSSSSLHTRRKTSFRNVHDSSSVADLSSSRAPKRSSCPDCLGEEDMEEHSGHISRSRITRSRRGSDHDSRRSSSNRNLLARRQPDEPEDLKQSSQRSTLSKTTGHANSDSRSNDRSSLSDYLSNHEEPKKNRRSDSIHSRAGRSRASCCSRSDCVSLSEHLSKTEEPKKERTSGSSHGSRTSRSCRSIQGRSSCPSLSEHLSNTDEPKKKRTSSSSHGRSHGNKNGRSSCRSLSEHLSNCEKPRKKTSSSSAGMSRGSRSLSERGFKNLEKRKTKRTSSSSHNSNGDRPVERTEPSGHKSTTYHNDREDSDKDDDSDFDGFAC